MHGSRVQNARLIDALTGPLLRDAAVVESVVCPPFVYLQEVARLLRDSGIGLGGQDLCADPPGAHTGEIAAAMLVDVGCSHVIVGHSERRSLYGETDEGAARKFAAALAVGLVPIFCIGESLVERESERTFDVIARQLDAVLDLSGAGAFERAVLAYEPVWAIGTGRTASPEQAQEVHAFIRGRIAARNATISGSVRILYGGSVKAANAGELFAQPDVDGGLIGGASLKAEEFVAIVAAAAVAPAEPRSRD